MPPSTSSFLELKAHLAKQEAEHQRKKASGQETYIKGGVQRPEKKLTKWAKHNKDVATRNARDLEWSAASKPAWETAKEALERKASQYDKLKRGKTAGLKESQYESLLVDFDKKAEDEGFDSDASEDRDADNSIAVSNENDDPIVEYIDEFGRSRKAPRSEIPRNLVPENAVETEEEDPYLIYDDPNYFPTFEPSAEKVLEVEKTLQGDSNPATHYDATKEVRARGAAFYQFSKDEETRRAQMEELRHAREATEQGRRESGATNEKPGKEKRKRDIEERRKAIEAKRRKLKGPNGLSTPGSTLDRCPREEDSINSKQSAFRESKEMDSVVQSTQLSADEFLAAVEREIIAKKRL